MKKLIALLLLLTLFQGNFEIQWEKSYGKLWWWSARYEGPQPIGDADNDGLNELLIGGRDCFLRIMKWNGKTYVEQARIIDPVFGIGYGIWIKIGGKWYHLPQPFGSATGFFVGDVDNDGLNEIGVAWGRHFSAFKWNGKRYELMGRYIIARDGWGTTLDCFLGDFNNDGENEIIVTGGYENVPSLIALKWDGEKFVKIAEWGEHSIYFPWIADVDNDGLNEIIVGHGRELVVLKWNGKEFTSYVIDRFPYQVFGCVAKDSNGDGIKEIHVTFSYPCLCIYRLNELIFDKTWSGEEDTIEAIDVGDVDNDGMAEVAVGTNYIHILQWTGETYEEEYTIKDTYGLLAVTCIGDIDNDGKNEIHASNVGVEYGKEYKAWIFKYR